MKKVFLECIYRISELVYNEGFLCIVDNKIFGVFTFDYVSITHAKDGFILQLNEYEPEEETYLKPQFLFCKSTDDTLESPNTYTFKSDILEDVILQIKNKVTNPKTISEVEKIFEEFPI